MEQLYANLDVDNYLLGIYLDFQKVIDTVNHEILWHKLHHYGIRGNILDCFKSYSKNRKQFTFLMKSIRKPRILNVEFLRGPSRDLYSSWYT